MARMTPQELGERALERLRELGIETSVGLCEAELDAIEDRFGFGFAPEHRAFLSAGLPLGRGWPDWRHGDQADLQFRLDGPVDGVLFDVAMNEFWATDWGPRPDDPELRDTRARNRLAQVPRLIPVFGHRFLPASATARLDRSAAAGPPPAPVLSVVQTDVAYYGADLLDYVEREFGGREGPVITPAPVAFWSDLI